MAQTNKAEGALLTISEVSHRLNVPTHILRYWETRFPQLRPMTRAGNRRYYRPEDVQLVTQINHWLHQEGYTIKGVQKLLREKGSALDAAGIDLTPHLISLRDELIRIRSNLAAALAG